jgi:hypothetical protein
MCTSAEAVADDGPTATSGRASALRRATCMLDQGFHLITSHRMHCSNTRSWKMMIPMFLTPQIRSSGLEVYSCLLHDLERAVIALHLELVLEDLGVPVHAGHEPEADGAADRPGDLALVDGP